MSQSNSGKIRVKLFSNLDFVQFGLLQINAHAAVLRTEWNDAHKRDVTRLVGHLYDVSMRPSFVWWMPSENFTVTSARSAHVMLTEGGDMEPLATGCILRFAPRSPLSDELRIQLVAHDSSKEILVESLDGHPADVSERLGALIRERIEQFWLPPCIPEISWRQRGSSR